MIPRNRPAPSQAATKPISRVRVSLPPPKDLPTPAKPVNFLTSGSHLLDRTLGGGWALGRVINVVGDRSSGKTLLAIEACANFAQRFDASSIRYVEAEAAFDEGYARTIGMPPGLKLTDDIRTVEQWEADLLAWLEPRKKADGPCMYVLDSLDALSDEAELDRKADAGSFGAAKAKKLSEMFRKRIKLLEERNCMLFVISQVRDKIGVMFGEKTSRSGGKALDFYASQILFLTERGKIRKKVLGAERVIGLNVGARTKKNKVGIPFRDVELSVYFSYGVDDEGCMLDWIKKHDCERLLSLSINETRAAVLESRKAKDRATLATLQEDIRSAVDHHWDRIEAALAPTMSKYGD